MMSRSLKQSRSMLSQSSDDASELQQIRPPLPPTVTFARRTSSGRYVNYSRDDLDSELGSGEFMNYTVQIPITPDNQPMSNNIHSDPTISQRVEEQYVSNSLFTGGFNSVTRAHLMDKVTDSETNHPQMAGAKGSSCAIPGCDGKVMSDGRGEDILPCECDFKICRDCYMDAVKSGESVCPGCKEPYKNTELDREAVDEERPLPLPAPPAFGLSKMERRLSLMKSTKSALMRSQTGDFDHNRWLFETKGTYGYGNAIWPKEGGSDNDGTQEQREFNSKPWRPLTRKLKIPAGVLSPYRLLIFIRMIVLSLFLVWRVRHPNQDAMWLWGMSVVCEIWFAFSWLLDQLPKLCPVNRATDLSVLKEKFETPSPENPTGKSDLPGIDIFVSTADPEKEPPLVTANTILSILASDYPVEKLSCYVSDDGGALLTFEAMAEAASFANVWVPFCRKHGIEPRNPESYFSLKKDPYKNKVRQDFVKDRRRVKREYDEFKVRINGLPDSIRRRSDAYHAREEIKALKHQRQNVTGDEPIEAVKISKATWMADSTHWPGTWVSSSPEHSKGDHAGIIQVMLKPPSDEPLLGTSEDNKFLDVTDVDILLPMLVYVSREKRPGYDHNKKAGAMNALVRASAIMSNGPFILNLDCDHYIYNSQAMREGMCFMMDRGGDRICYVQFPQRFEGIDPSDRYANNNTVFFDVNMRALDGLQGPVYVGTGCLFRRVALYGFDPPRSKDRAPSFWDCCFSRRKKRSSTDSNREENRALRMDDFDDEEMSMSDFPKKFGNSRILVDSIPVAEYEGRPLADHPSVKNGRPPGALTIGRQLLDATTVAEAINVISCWYEDKTEWGQRVGWIYGSVTEDVVTGYRMHNRGWKSIYCVTSRDAFRGTAPINLTDRLHQVLRWATGSVEIFFSRNNAFLASPKMKFLQRIAYLNVDIYPFTSNVPSPPPPQLPVNPPPADKTSAQDPKPRKDNPRTMAGGFEPEALERGAEALKKIVNSSYAKQTFDIIKKQEETKQQEMTLKVQEFKKMLADAEIEKQRVLYDEQKKLVQQQAQTKSQMAKYEDELVRKRMAAENELHRQRNQELVKLQEESSMRQQHARRETEEHIQKQRRQTEKEKAELLRQTIVEQENSKARGNALEEQLNEEVNRRKLMLTADLETQKWIAAINTTFKHIGGGIQDILTDQNQLVVVVGGITALAAGIYTTREGAKVMWNYVDRILGQPSLIRESSRGKYPWSGLTSRHMLSKLKGLGGGAAASKNGNGFGDVILHPSLNKRIEQLASATANTKAHQAPFRNMLFYGPPGTGKTMAARELARKSGLDYALMTGGDVAPLGSEAVTKIHQLFDWAKNSNKGLLLFIDEADAFLCERNKTYMSEAQRSALNALLFRTGDQSKDFVLALATNRPEDLDSAVSDRIDEVLEFPLPGKDERFKLIKLYLDKYIAQAGSGKPGLLKSLFKNKQQKIDVKGLTDDVLREAADKTEGFSGREIAKLMASVQAAVYGSEDCVLDPQLFREVVDYKAAEHQQRRKFADESANNL